MYHAHRVFSGIVCQQQNFRETPEDTEVAEGSSTILKCSVNHRKGDVQWVKDGVVLGREFYTCLIDPGKGSKTSESILR